MWTLGIVGAIIAFTSLWSLLFEHEAGDTHLEHPV